MNKEERIEIREADNGYIIEKYFLYDEPDIIQMERIVVEQDESEKGEKEAIIRLLQEIANWTGKYLYDKYREDNLNITFDKKGHKANDNKTEE